MHRPLHHRRAAAVSVLALSGMVSASAASAETAEIASLRQRDAAAALHRGSNEEAIGHYTTALSAPELSYDRRATLLNDRAVAYVRLGKTQLAVDDFNKAVELFPEYAPTYNNRGNLLMALGLYEEAIKDFNRAIVLAPGYGAAYHNRAGALMRSGAAGAAVTDFTQAIRLAPTSAAPLTGRGKAHLELGRPHLALRDFGRAVGSDVRFAAAYRSRAEALIELGRHEEAIEDLSRAIAFDIANAELYLLRGHAYLAVGNAEAALQDFARTIELAPQSTGGYEARALALSLTDEFEAAFADLSRALGLNPRSAIAFAYRGHAYARSGQYEIAERDLETAEKIDANNADVHWARGVLEDLRGQTDAAVEYLRKAVELAPGFKRAKDALLRLGAADGTDADIPVPGRGADGWDVVSAGGQLFAVAQAYQGVRVPIEMQGDGEPKVLAWRPGEPPFRDIGVLTYHSGTLVTAKGTEPTELAAIVDLRSRQMVALVPHRQGGKVATWTWSADGKVKVAAVDGTTDELTLREQRQGPLAAATPGRRLETGGGLGGTPAWAPWANQPWATPEQGRPRRAAAPPPRAKKKPKTLFDLLFNN